MLSLKYYCGQRKYPSVCSLKKMKVEACASTYTEYQERTQVVWQDCLQSSPYAHLLSRKSWLLFLSVCCKTSNNLGSGWLAELWSCSSNTDKQLICDHEKRTSALQDQWTGCQKNSSQDDILLPEFFNNWHRITLSSKKTASQNSWINLR